MVLICINSNHFACKLRMFYKRLSAVIMILTCDFINILYMRRKIVWNTRYIFILDVKLNYITIIEPVFFYCNGIFIGDSYTSMTKFQKIQDRAFMYEAMKNTTGRRGWWGEKSKYIASGMATPLPKNGTPATQVNFFLSLGTAERSMHERRNYV